MTGVYIIILMMTPDHIWLKLISYVLFFVSFFILACILNYTNHNDIFKTIRDLEKERALYHEAKGKYINAQIDKIEK